MVSAWTRTRNASRSRRSRNSSKAPPASLSGSASRSAWRPASSRSSPHRRLARLQGRPQERRPDRPHRRNRRAASRWTRPSSACAATRTCKVNLSIYRKNEPQLPGHHHPQGDPDQSVKAKVIEPGYAWLRISQFQERTLDDFVARVEDLYRQGANLKGPGARHTLRPGGLLDRAIVAWRPSCHRTSRSCPPKARWSKPPSVPSRVITAAAPAMTRCAACRAGFKNPYRGGARQRRLSQRQRDRGRRAAGPPSRHRDGAQTFGKASVQTPICLANEACRSTRPSPCSRSPRPATTRPAATSIQASASRPTCCWTKPPRATGPPRCTREADLEKHLAARAEGAGKGRSPHQGP